MSYFGRPNDTIFDDLKKIADAVAGEETSYDGTKDILRRSLERIADALENGGGAGGGDLVINATLDAETGHITLDKTAGEIVDAIKNRGCYIAMPGDGTIDCYTITYVNSNYDGNGQYYFRAYSGNEELELYAATEDDYPTTEESGGDGQRINFDLITSGSEEEINYAPVTGVDGDTPVLGETSTVIFKSGGNGVTITLPKFEVNGNQCSGMVIYETVRITSQITGVSVQPSANGTTVQIALEHYDGSTIPLFAGGLS